MSEASRLHLATSSLKIVEDDISSFIALFAYAGFNPEMVHDHFSRIRKEKDISMDDFLLDLKTIVVLGAMKGNYTTKNSGKISKEGKTKADDLYAKYQMKKGEVGADRRSITLPRVLSAFPEVTARIVLRCPDKNFGTRTTGLSKLIKSPVFAAIVPNSMDTKVKTYLLNLYNIYSAEQTLAISKVTTFDEALEKQRQYTEIAHNSVVPSETMRIAIFKSSIALLKGDAEVGNRISEMTSKITPAEMEQAITSLATRSEPF